MVRASELLLGCGRSRGAQCRPGANAGWGGHEALLGRLGGEQVLNVRQHPEELGLSLGLTEDV
jgi:hypothetical protein